MNRQSKTVSPYEKLTHSFRMWLFRKKKQKQNNRTLTQKVWGLISMNSQPDDKPDIIKLEVVAVLIWLLLLQRVTYFKGKKTPKIYAQGLQFVTVTLNKARTQKLPLYWQIQMVNAQWRKFKSAIIEPFCSIMPSQRNVSFSERIFAINVT